MGKPVLNRANRRHLPLSSQSWCKCFKGDSAISVTFVRGMNFMMHKWRISMILLNHNSSVVKKHLRNYFFHNNLWLFLPRFKSFTYHSKGAVPVCNWSKSKSCDEYFFKRLPRLRNSGEGRLSKSNQSQLKHFSGSWTERGRVLRFVRFTIWQTP